MYATFNPVKTSRMVAKGESTRTALSPGDRFSMSDIVQPVPAAVWSPRNGKDHKKWEHGIEDRALQAGVTIPLRSSKPSVSLIVKRFADFFGSDEELAACGLERAIVYASRPRSVSPHPGE